MEGKYLNGFLSSKRLTQWGLVALTAVLLLLIATGVINVLGGIDLLQMTFESVLAPAAFGAAVYLPLGYWMNTK